MDIHKRIIELENEKSKSKYIKKGEREEILAQVARRKQLQEELR